jgi:hypothetical protein
VLEERTGFPDQDDHDSHRGEHRDQPGSQQHALNDPVADLAIAQQAARQAGIFD